MVLVRVPPYFVERLRLLSESRAKHIIGRLEWFQNWPDDPKLKLRPLRCSPGHFLISSIHGDRIILRLEANGVYVAADCGGHEIIDEWERLAGGT